MDNFTTMPLRFRVWEKDNQQFSHEVLPNDEVRKKYVRTHIEYLEKAIETEESLIRRKERK